VAEKKTPATPAKAKKVKKASGFKRYLKELKGEFKKITWPTWSSLCNNTWATIAMCAIVGAIVCVIDFGLDALVNLLLSL